VRFAPLLAKPGLALSRSGLELRQSPLQWALPMHRRLHTSAGMQTGCLHVPCYIILINCPCDPGLPIKLSVGGGVACMHACSKCTGAWRQGPGLAHASPATQPVRMVSSMCQQTPERPL